MIGRQPSIVNAISFTRDGKRFATCGGNAVKIWDAATLKEITTLRDFRERVACVAFSPDGKWLATTGSGEPARVYETTHWRVRHKLDELAAGSRFLAFSPDGKVLAIANSGDFVSLWDPTTGQQLGVVPLGIRHLMRLAFSPDGKTLAGSGQGKVVLYDLAKKRVRASLDGHRAIVRGLAFSADGETLVTAEIGMDRKVFLWDSNTGNLRKQLDITKTTLAEVFAVAFSPDGKGLAIVGFSASAHLFDLASGKEWATLKSVNSIYESVAFSPDGKTLITGCTDGTAKVWDVPDREAGLKAAVEADRIGRIDRLVVQLGEPGWLEREQAARALIKLGAQSLISLEKGARSENPETVRRSLILFDHLTSKRDDRMLRQLVNRVAPDGIDYLVEQLVRKGKATAEGEWQAVQEIARAASKHCQSLGVPEFQGPDYGKFPVLVTRELNADRPIFQKRVLAEQVSAEWQAAQCILVCSGPVSIPRTLGDSILFANGPLKIDDVRNSIIVCSDEIDIGSAKNSVILSKGGAKVRGIRDSVIEWDEPNPLGVFKFFDPAQQGIEVKAVNDSLQVATVHADKPFAKAGIQKGDIIIAIDNAKPVSAEDFRKLLRRKVVEGHASLTLRRQQKELQVQVKFPH